MNTAEGFNRVAKVIVILGWCMAAFCLLGALLLLGSGEVEVAIAAMVCGAICIGAGKGIAWIITGFTAPKEGETSDS
ncbi:hypothetical protein [Paraburkholderia mimosarum]|uniref:hypothetical protein n=1 Tax=Paraburkholderia mimosarum TaxID=312026 RepID=UPI0004825F9C|nr:hypothetical protein [Paraburkholderia mimosarum]